MSTSRLSPTTNTPPSAAVAGGAPAARRRVAIAIAIAALALLATGCAEEGGASREHAAASRSQAEPRGAAAGTCRKILASFLGSMDALRRKLTVGLTYGQYLGELRTVRVAYRGIPADRLRLGCLLAAGTPGERALNRYTEAANAWGDCLAAPSCDVEAVEPRLQRLWARAAGLLSAARSGA